MERTFEIYDLKIDRMPGPYFCNTTSQFGKTIKLMQLRRWSAFAGMQELSNSTVQKAMEAKLYNKNRHSIG